MSENISSITPAQAIDAMIATFPKDSRFTAYQITSIANAALELLGKVGDLKPQPTYGMTKSLRAAAEAKFGIQTIAIDDIKPIVTKLVAKGLGEAVAGGKIDKEALKANALKALTATTAKVEQPKK